MSSWMIEPVSYEICPSGSHGAVLVALLDLGSQWSEFGDKPGKWMRQLHLIWELTSAKDSEEENFLIGKTYTWSLHEKSALRGMIKQWRGRDLADGEQFDLLKILGQKCLVSISHASKGDKTFAQLDGVSAPPAGMKIEAATHEPFCRSITEDKLPADWLPRIYGKPLAEVVNASREVEEGKAPALPVPESKIDFSAAARRSEPAAPPPARKPQFKMAEPAADTVPF